MRTESKSLAGVMNLDDPRDTFPKGHHKESRNGVFRGNPGFVKFQSIRGNQKITNSNLKTEVR
jgi:hypothetical protein